MEFYPLNAGAFANRSVTSSFAVTASFAAGIFPSASNTLFPTGSRGPVGDSGGVIYLLSSSLLVCGTTTTTTTTTAALTTTTTSTSTTTTTSTSTTSTSTTSTSTTTTTTGAPVCAGYCETVEDCNPGCVCANTGGKMNTCNAA